MLIDGPVEIVDDDWYALFYGGFAITSFLATSRDLLYSVGFGSLGTESTDKILIKSTSIVGGEEEGKRDAK